MDPIKYHILEACAPKNEAEERLHISERQKLETCFKIYHEILKRKIKIGIDFTFSRFEYCC